MAHLNSHKEICNLFKRIENKFPVDQWKVNNLHVWPYIRIKLYYYLLNIENTQIEEKSAISQNRKKKSIKATTKEVVKSFFDTRQFYNSLKSKEVIFVGAHFHRVLQNGVYFNRFFDPLIEKYNLKERAYTFEFQKYYPNSFNKNSVFHLANAIRNYKSFKRIEEKLITKPCTANLINYDDFQEFLNNELGEGAIFKITENDLKKWSKKIINLTPFFEKIIKKVKPNKIVFLSYYGFDDNYAFIYTARKMQIKVVDFQHGPQSNIHMAYSEWNKVPQDGFNIMPIEYWNWDDNSKKNIEAWANKTEVKAKVVGHPYIEYCLKHEKVENTKKQILFSLQTSPLELLTKEVTSLIYNSKYHWVLRLHPRNEIPLIDIKNFLIQNRIDHNTELQTAEDIPLPYVLTKSILHITNYSGCVIEALTLNTVTVIIHNVGFEMFRNYIDDKKVFYVNRTSKDFESRVLEILSLQTEKSGSLDIFYDFNPID